MEANARSQVKSSRIEGCNLKMLRLVGRTRWRRPHIVELMWLAVAVVAVTFGVVWSTGAFSASTYSASETVLITSPRNVTTTMPAPRQAAPSSSLLALYAEIANSKAVRALAVEKGALHGAFLAYVLDVRPFVRITAYADSPRRAILIATRVSEAFIRYCLAAMRHAAIPAAQRLSFELVESPKSLKSTKATNVPDNANRV